MIPSFPRFVKETADRYRNKVFLCDFETGRSITYHEFDRITDRLARGFMGIGLEKGDRVALFHPNQSDFILCYVGVIKAGGVAVLINSLYTPREIRFILSDSRPRVLVTTDELSEKVEPIAAEMPFPKLLIVKGPERTLEEVLSEKTGPPASAAMDAHAPDDLAIIFYTSGTTGTPKGVMLTHRNLAFGGANVAQNYGLREEDVTIAVLPLVHVFANASPVLGSFSSGGKVIVMQQFKAHHVFEAIERHRITWFPGVPTMFHYLLSAVSSTPRDLSSLRMGLSGGASLPVAALGEFETRFHAEILEVYGLTESTGLVTANPVYGIRKPGSIGMTVSGVETKVVSDSGRECPQGEVGELLFRGPNAAAGYWNRPEETANRIRNGWVRTGDHVYRDRDGYFFLVGRENELIVSGGFNIYQKEIETVLSSHPHVHEAAVIGVADTNKGEIPKAFVTLKPGAEKEEAALLAHCRQNLAAYKVPRLAFIDELPKNPVGKVDKNRLPRD